MYFDKTFIFMASALLVVVSAIPIEHYFDDAENIAEIYEINPLEYKVVRVRRSLQPGAPNLPGAPNQQGGWEVNPNINRDDSGNTNTGVEVTHKGKDHDFNAGWNKVVRGPGKAKPSWHVGGTFRW